jgi:hypothetical protein
VIRPENRPAPAARVTSAGEPSYAELSEAWARGLTESNLREMAYECLRTPESSREDYMMDALREYQRRETAGLLREQKSTESNLKSSKSKSRNDARKGSRQSRV